MSGKKTLRKRHANHDQFHWLIIQTMVFVIVSIVVSIFLYQSGIFTILMQTFHTVGYVGAFISGMFFVSLFTAAPALVMLVSLSQTLPLIPLAIAAGIGAVIGDILIFSFLRSDSKQIDKHTYLQESSLGKVIISIRRSKYKFFLTLLGGLVILTPLPDELGLLLMGITSMKRMTSIVLTFLLNTIGIWIILNLLT